MKIKENKITLVLFMAAIMWLVHVVNWLLPYELNNFGILPRTARGLIGIVAAPFLHANWLHLIGNTIPFVVLGLLLVIFYDRHAVSVIGFVMFFGGGLIWALGRSAFHVGASGLIYGMAAFLFFFGIFKKNILSIAVSAIVGFLYGGTMITGILPVRGFVSWESHLFCAAAGVLAAYLLKNVPEKSISSTGSEPPQRF